MPITTIKEIFSDAWSLVTARQDEIKSGPYGTFDRVYKEEMEKTFLNAEMAGGLMGGVSGSTARKWLARIDARFIYEGGGMLFYRADVVAARDARNKYYAEIAEKKKSKQSTKEG